MTCRQASALEDFTFVQREKFKLELETACTSASAVGENTNTVTAKPNKANCSDSNEMTFGHGKLL